MESKSIAIGWRTALILAVFTLIGGLICIFVPDFILNAKFQGYTGQAWGSFASANEELAYLYRIDLREVGAMCFSIATLITGVVLNGYRQGETWAWFTLLVAGVFACGSPLYVGISTGCWVCLMMGGSGAVLLAIAILAPARAILAQK
jgi:hypothetical protein